MCNLCDYLRKLVHKSLEIKKKGEVSLKIQVIYIVDQSGLHKLRNPLFSLCIG